MGGGIAEQAGARIIQADAGIDLGPAHRQAIARAIGDADLDLAQAGARAARQPLDHIAVIAAARQGIGRGEGAAQSQRQAAIIVAPQFRHQPQGAAGRDPVLVSVPVWVKPIPSHCANGREPVSAGTSR